MSAKTFRLYFKAGFFVGVEIAGYVREMIVRKLELHKLIKLRQRYILTRCNRVRLRYVLSTGVFLLTAAVSLVSGPASSLALRWDAAAIDRHMSESSEFEEAYAAIEPAAGDAHEHHGHEDFAFADQPDQPALSAGITNMISESLRSQVSDGIRRASRAIQKSEKPMRHDLSIGSGDTIAGVLQTTGVNSTDAHNAIEALREYYDPRHVKPGQKISVNFKPAEGDDVAFSDMVVKIDPVKEVRIEKSGDEFKAEVVEKELVEQVYAGNTKIQTSLYGSAARAGIPSHIIAEMIRVYSWDVDFQRDIREGDGIEVLYNVYETEDGEFAKYGNVMYANLSVRGRDIPIYRYEMEDGRVDYFQPDGHSVRKTLMKTPIDGARISSGFGMRKHPVLGYNKMHKGMDFAAPTGTPIYAAGNGTVEFAARHGAYGNYVRIRHNGSLKTAYAHMHKFGKSIKKGTKVEQGDIIGYVGTTGRSTGPHLHYEVLLDGAQVNPTRVDLPTGEQLVGNDLKKFKSLMSTLSQKYVSLIDDMKLAYKPAQSNKVQ
jgi:murein DD-endopeptidase MepM/ murein hydrolase activator NlpD